jgi:RND superfamily putative drug exporter
MIQRLSALALRPRRVLVTAGAVFAIAAALGLPVLSTLKSQSSDFQDPNSQSQQVLRAIERASGQTAEYGVAALVPAGADVRRDPAAAAPAARVVQLLSAQRGFERALDYPATHLPVLVSGDGRRTLVLAAFATRDQSAAAVERVSRALPGSGVRFGGNDVAFHEINKRTTSDLSRAEMLAFPLLLALSFWVFRGLVAAALPLLVGGFAIVVTFLLLRVVDQFAGLSIFAVNLVTGLGLGLGIDYSLFVLSRYREELAGGADTREAIARTLGTAGRTVLYSSLTVAGALACLLVFPLRFLYSMGAGGALVALSAGAVSLLVLPAVLVALGPRINALAPARLQQSAARAARPAESGAWFRLSHAVMRRPGAVVLATTALLLVLAAPALRLALAPADARALPSSSQPRQVAEALTHDFPANGAEAITVVVRAPGTAAGARAVATLAQAAAREAAGQASVASARFRGRDTWQLELLPRGPEGAPANQRLVKRLRRLAPSATLLVGGPTAAFVDQKAAIAAHAPLALAILGVVTFGFLFMMTGSLILPILAVAMNVLTVAVGAGLLVLIFQDGHGSGLLGFSTIGGLEEANLVLLFVVAFALSTDYGVFLYARIKEAHSEGMAARAAVAYGLERTGRLVTAAALLFCVAIGAFATSHIFFIKQLGVGAALAIAIDATVVRALLVPALMGTLGERAWWAPKPLRRLHGLVGLREGDLGGARA